jgi:hypothetical protein
MIVLHPRKKPAVEITKNRGRGWGEKWRWENKCNSIILARNAEDLKQWEWIKETDLKAIVELELLGLDD